LPQTGSSGGFNYEIIQGIAVLEGDILLGRVNQDGSLPIHAQPRGLGRSDAFGRWPDGIVPFAMPTSNSNIQKQRIALAIEHWTERTSVTFVERTTDNQNQYPNYIRFDSSNSCASYVGMQGGSQSILVSDACSTGSIIHEIGHALGLFHEHTRPDRDNFAQIDWQQVVSGKEINFEVLEAGVQFYGPYDYGSIMHYGEFFFTATGDPTIIVPDGISIGQRQGLSEQDARSIDEMYATDLALLRPTLNTVSEGIEIGISIANQGQLGAQKLELIATVSEDTNWQGISPDSGWDCSTSGIELHCTRPTLTEQSETRFTLLIDSEALSDEDVSLVLSSRTTDTDLSNNRFNDNFREIEPDPTELDLPPVVIEQPMLQAAEPVVEEQEPEIVVEIPENISIEPPKPSAANPVTGQESAAPVSAEKATPAAGSDNGVLSSLLGLALLWHRRRVRKNKDASAYLH